MLYKSGITYVCFHNYAKIKIDFLPLEKTLALLNILIHISSFS